MNKLFILSALALILCMSFGSAAQVNESVTATWNAEADGGNAQRGWVINSEVNANIISITKQSDVSGVSSGRIYVTSNGTVIGTVAFSGNVATFASPVSLVAGLNYSITAGHTTGGWTRVINTSALSPQDTGRIRWGTGVSYIDGGAIPSYSASGYNIFALIVDYTPFTVNLTNPLNNTGLNTTIGKTFNATGIFGLGTAVNATRYLYTSTGTLISTNFSNVIYAGNKTNFTMPSLVDGTYLWNINMCGSSGDCFFAPSNFTFTIDSDAPSVNGDRPTNGSYVYSLNSTTSQFQINVTASDSLSSIDKVWYTSTWNSTPTLVTNGAVSTVTLNNVFGKQTIYKWANDTAGNVGLNSTVVYVHKYIFNPSTSSTSSETYSLELFNLSTSPSGQNFTYNGIVYTPIVATTPQGTYTLNSTRSVPSGVNPIQFFFRWIDTQLRTSDIRNQTNSNLSIYVCTSPNINGLTLNFTTYDSNSPTVPLNASFEGTFSIYSASGSGETTSNFSYASINQSRSNWMFCLNSSGMNVTANAFISYYATGYDSRDYIIQDGLIGNFTQNIPLYLAATSLTDIVTITVKNQGYDPIPGALVTVQEWNIGTNTFSTVGMFTTSSDGTGLMNLELYNKWYRAIVSIDGAIVATTDIQKMPDTTWDIIVTTGTDNPYSLFGTISHGLTLNNVTNITTFTWSDSSGYTQKGCLIVKNNTLFGYRTISTECQTTTAGTISYLLPADGDYYIQGVIFLNSEYDVSQIVDELFVRLGTPAEISAISRFGKVISMILVGTGGLIGVSASSPVWGVGLIIITMFTAWKLGWLNLTSAIFIAFVIVLIIVLFRQSRSGR